MQKNFLAYVVQDLSCYKSDFNPSADTFESYHKRIGTIKRLFKLMITLKDNFGDKGKNVTKKLNYSIK